MTFAELVRHVDAFVSKYGVTGNDREKIRGDVLDLVQKAIEHGEAKDQTKIGGILAKGISALFGRKD